MLGTVLAPSPDSLAVCMAGITGPADVSCGDGWNCCYGALRGFSQGGGEAQLCRVPHFDNFKLYPLPLAVRGVRHGGEINGQQYSNSVLGGSICWTHYFYSFLSPFSMSDSKPKSSSPVRLPEANVGSSNRGAEPEQRKTVLSKSYLWY